MNNTTTKRAQTSYGQVEYDAITCAECTNDTVTDDVTHIHVAKKSGEGFDDSVEGMTDHYICMDCLHREYGIDTEPVPSTELVEYYHNLSGNETLFKSNRLLVNYQEYPTPHGTVEVKVGVCSRCDSEWVTNKLQAVYVPVNIIDGVLRSTVHGYCPDCRELYLNIFMEESNEQPNLLKWYVRWIGFVFIFGMSVTTITGVFSGTIAGIVFTLVIVFMVFLLLDGFLSQKVYEYVVFDK